VKDRIDLFVLGALTAEERAAMAEARRHDAVLDRAVDEAECRLAPMALAAGEVSPPAALWDRIEAGLDGGAEALAGRVLVPYAEGDWLTIAPGIECKRLWGERTMLIRGVPGAVLPCHEHDDEEHLLVLSGDLLIGGRSFRPGDYIRSPRGADRFPHTTRTGCLILQQIGA
jgi:hypothetical protein